MNAITGPKQIPIKYTKKIFFGNNEKKVVNGECWVFDSAPKIGPHTLWERDMGHRDTPQTLISLLLSGSALIYSPISINLNLFWSRQDSWLKSSEEDTKAFTLYFLIPSDCHVLADRLGIVKKEPSRHLFAWADWESHEENKLSTGWRRHTRSIWCQGHIA